MVGILLALKVNNWNEWRKDRNLELNYLRNIKSEMHENLQHANDLVEFSQFQFENINRILEALYDLEYEINGDLLVAIEHAGWTHPLTCVSDTWDELVTMEIPV